jgi:hypothetical protein
MTMDLSGEDAGSEQWEADSLSNESTNDLSAFSATVGRPASVVCIPPPAH